MKITVDITEADIRTDIEQAAVELEEDNQIQFPDRDARADFIDDCVAGETDKYELYDRDPLYRPEYRMLVLDLARLYGFLV